MKQKENNLEDKIKDYSDYQSSKSGILKFKLLQ